MLGVCASTNAGVLRLRLRMTAKNRQRQEQQQKQIPSHSIALSANDRKNRKKETLWTMRLEL
jgi:hypothetical protein